MSRLAVRLSSVSHWVRGRIEEGGNPDRGDISITTIIIWFAAVGGAVLIAGSIGVVIAKYNGKILGI